MDNGRVANPMTGVSGEGHAWSLMIHALLLSVVNQNRVSGPGFRHYRQQVSSNHHPRARKQLDNSREIIIDSKQKLVSRSGGEIPIIPELTRPSAEQVVLTITSAIY